MSEPLQPIWSLTLPAERLHEYERLAELQTAITDALIRDDSARDVLQSCAEAIVRHLEAAFARIWTVDATGTLLELQASAGMYTHLDGAHGRVPVGQFKIGLIAQERRPHLTNSVADDPRVSDHEWAVREGMVSFAGYPLLVEGRLAGVVAMFARRPLSDAALDTLGAVASGIAIGIERKRAEAERDRALAAADQERQRLQVLFMQAPAFICSLRGPDHVFEFANPRYQQLVSRRDIVGKSIREALPEFADQGIYELLDGVYTTGEAFEGHEIPAAIDRNGDGVAENGYFTFVYQPTRSADGSIDGILVHGVEVTDQVRARQMMEGTIQMRDEFLGAISHDLRTPLATIRGMVQLSIRQAARMDIPEATRLAERLHVADGAVDRMSSMIDEILDLTRLDSNRPLELEREAVDLVALTGVAVRDQQERAPQHRITLRSEVPALIGLWDAARLERVLANLLSNAVKYSPGEGEIQISIAPEAGAGGAWARLIVRDNGVGIPAADLPHVFERFHRSTNVTGRIKGVGIGLAGAKQIVEQHNGTIAIASVEGGGTTATVRLPCDGHEGSGAEA